MRQLLFVHSAGPQGRREGSGWFVASLRKALGAQYELRSPIMPDPDKPAYAPWKERLEKELAALEDEALVVGHSLGGSVVLKVLSETKHTRPIAGIFLVATPFWGGSGEVEEFALRKDFAARLPKTPRVFLYHSRDDDVVPFAHLALYSGALPRATVRELDGYGHLFKKSCPELVGDIRTP